MRWTTENLGAQAVVYAGQGTADHARTAIQLLSRNQTTRTVFAHTGWRDIQGVSVYLHSGGAIGAEGAVAGVEVELPPELVHFKLELPVDPISAIRASLQIIGIARTGSPFLLSFDLPSAAWRGGLHHFFGRPNGLF